MSQNGNEKALFEPMFSSEFSRTSIQVVFFNQNNSKNGECDFGEQIIILVKS